MCNAVFASTGEVVQPTSMWLVGNSQQSVRTQQFWTTFTMSPDIISSVDDKDSSLAVVVIDENPGTLVVDAKDVIKARNIQRMEQEKQETYDEALDALLNDLVSENYGEKGSSPKKVGDMYLPASLPMTGAMKGKLFYLLIALFWVIGLCVTMYLPSKKQ